MVNEALVTCGTCGLKHRARASGCPRCAATPRHHAVDGRGETSDSGMKGGMKAQLREELQGFQPAVFAKEALLLAVLLGGSMWIGMAAAEAGGGKKIITLAFFVPALFAFTLLRKLVNPNAGSLLNVLFDKDAATLHERLVFAAGVAIWFACLLVWLSTLTR